MVSNLLQNGLQLVRVNLGYYRPPLSAIGLRNIYLFEDLVRQLASQANQVSQSNLISESKLNSQSNFDIF